MSLGTDDKTPELSRLYTSERDKIWEKQFGLGTVVVDSAQRAVQICLELLNSGVKGFPVVMPVTAPPTVVGGVLRSGAVPLLLDINPVTLDMEASLFKEAVKEFGDSMVTLFCEVPGQPISASLLECLAPHSVSLLYSPTYPRDECSAAPHTFMIKDLKKLVDKGAVIFHDYEEQLSLLYAARDGVLGHDAKLTTDQEKDLAKKLGQDRMVFGTGKKEFDRILNAFRGTGIAVLWEQSLYHEEFAIAVPNADKAVATLTANYFMARKLINPLHVQPMVAARYQEKASYPNAESLTNRIISIPVMDYEQKSLDNLVRLLQEEYNGQ